MGNRITRVLKSERGKEDQGGGSVRALGLVLLALKTEEGATSRGMWVSLCKPEEARKWVHL